MIIKARDLFLKQKRFDLIFKYLYLKNKDKNHQFYEDLYVEHIRAFNNFEEVEPSDGIAKDSKEKFINSFNSLFNNMREKGFDSSRGIIPIGNNGEISDGAHRLVCATILGLDVEVKNDGRNDLYDYKFFLERGINIKYADYAALEYVKLNPDAYIVNLHSVSDRNKDTEVETILEKYGFIFYKKNIYLNFNGYVNLKKISYGSFWNRESWIGTVKNKFAGAQMHAKQSMGSNPLRAYVFICDDIKKVIEAKQEIRDLFKIDNFSVHINDSKEEAICLAQTYFNNNSLEMLNSRPFVYENPSFDKMLFDLRENIKTYQVNTEDVCGAGSTPFDIYGLRKSSDLDFLYCGSKNFDLQTETLSNHDSQLKYYPYPKKEIIYNPKYHFYYNGIKFISLDILYSMKKNRNEKPKDIRDCRIIRKFKRNKPFKLKCYPFKLFDKIKHGNKRTIILFGFIKFSYRKR